METIMSDHFPLSMVQILTMARSLP